MNREFENLSAISDVVSDRDDINLPPEQGLEALPMTYVLEIETLLDSYQNYQKEKTPASQAAFAEAAKRIAGMRKLFASNQEGFIAVQKEIRNALNRHNLGIGEVDPEGVLEDIKTADQKTFSQEIMIGRQSISPYDKKIMDILSEAGM